jgi:hypothetical protein
MVRSKSSPESIFCVSAPHDLERDVYRFDAFVWPAMVCRRQPTAAR